MQKHTSHQVGWKYTVTALALSVAMAPMAQAASVLKSTGKLEITGTPTSRTAGTTSMAEAAELVASKTKALAGQKYTFQKWLDAKGNVDVIILDEKGNAVSESALPKIAQVILEPELEDLLRTRSGRRGVHKVNVALDLGLTVPTERPQTGIVEMNEQGETQLQIDGRTVSEKDLARLQASEQQARGQQAAARVEERLELLEAFAKRHNIELPKEALASLTSTLTVELTAEQIEDLANSDDSTILGIELYEKGQDDLSAAMTDTGIDPWALDYASTRGDGIGIYQTESGCANESGFSEYTRLDGSHTNHSRVVASIIKGVAPEAYLYCRGGAVLPTSVDLHGTWLSDWVLDLLGISRVDIPIQVVTRSNGTNYSTSYDTDDRDWDDFIYDEEIPAFKSAGNEGWKVGEEYVSSPGKGLNITTVGNYNDDTDTINGGSSFIDPETGNEKPEISAPGTAISIDGVDEGSGTSWAAPHAAAFTADSLSSYSWLQYKPHLAKAKQLAGATDEISGGVDAVGLGGIDFLSSHYSGWNYWMHAANGSYVSLDAADGSTDGHITREVYISSSYDAVRIAMTWLSRGTYVYSHRSDAHPIGMDFDLQVFDPSGTRIARSLSWDNGFEVVDFPPTTSGTYTFKINRYANRDSSNNIRLGVAVNFYNE